MCWYACTSQPASPPARPPGALFAARRCYCVPRCDAAPRLSTSPAWCSRAWRRGPRERAASDSAGSHARGRFQAMCAIRLHPVRTAAWTGSPSKGPPRRQLAPERSPCLASFDSPRRTALTAGAKQIAALGTAMKKAATMSAVELPTVVAATPASANPSGIDTRLIAQSKECGTAHALGTVVELSLSRLR